MFRQHVEALVPAKFVTIAVLDCGEGWPHDALGLGGTVCLAIRLAVGRGTLRERIDHAA